MSSSSSLPQGCWLFRRQSYSLRRRWCRRYFVLSHDQLHYYRDETDTKPLGVIDLSTCRIDVRFDKNRIVEDVFSHLRDAKNKEVTILTLRVDDALRCEAWLENQPQSPLPVQLTDMLDYDSDDVLSKCLEKLDLATTPVVTPSMSHYSSTSSISSLSETVKAPSTPPPVEGRAPLFSFISTLRHRTRTPKPTLRPSVFPAISAKQARHPLVHHGNGFI